MYTEYEQKEIKLYLSWVSEWELLKRVCLFAAPWTIAHRATLSMGFSRMLEWVAMPFSRGWSWPRDQTRVSHTAVKFFIIWANTEAKLFFSSVQSINRVWLFATPWTAGCQASLFITNSRSLLKLMSIESVMPYNHLILCHPLLFLPSIFPSIRVLSNESAVHIRWPAY